MNSGLIVPGHLKAVAEEAAIKASGRPLTGIPGTVEEQDTMVDALVAAYEAADLDKPAQACILAMTTRLQKLLRQPNLPVGMKKAVIGMFASAILELV